MYSIVKYNIHGTYGTKHLCFIRTKVEAAVWTQLNSLNR